MECKVSLPINLYVRIKCRNRYIVECKVAEHDISLASYVVEIDTLWNVKTISPITEHIGSRVEIDTLWNVKLGTIRIAGRMIHVEIDTLWNVKILAVPQRSEPSSVEIDTLWNVK